MERIQWIWQLTEGLKGAGFEETPVLFRLLSEEGGYEEDICAIEGVETNHDYQRQVLLLVGYASAPDEADTYSQAALLDELYTFAEDCEVIALEVGGTTEAHYIAGVEADDTAASGAVVVIAGI